MVFLPVVGLDTAEKHRLLDQQGLPKANCQVASFFFQYNHLEIMGFNHKDTRPPKNKRKIQ
jgi:hypothetical protein